MTNEPKDRRAQTSPQNGKRGGRPAKADCTCGSPGGKHRQPCPVYRRERRELRQVMSELERVAEEMGISRAEAVRRAVRLLREEGRDARN